MTNTEIKVGAKVEAYDSRCVGMLIESWAKAGTIVKANKKSIIVEFNHMVHKFGNKVQADTNYYGKERFTFWKTTDDGRTIYKSQLNGIIEF